MERVPDNGIWTAVLAVLASAGRDLVPRPERLDPGRSTSRTVGFRPIGQGTDRRVVRDGLFRVFFFFFFEFSHSGVSFFEKKKRVKKKIKRKKLTWKCQIKV
jgi:hypothetical protein